MHICVDKGWPRVLVVEPIPVRESFQRSFSAEDHDVRSRIVPKRCQGRVRYINMTCLLRSRYAHTMIGGDVVRRIKADLRTARHSGIVNSAFEEYVKRTIAVYKPTDF